MKFVTQFFLCVYSNPMTFFSSLTPSFCVDLFMHILSTFFLFSQLHNTFSHLPSVSCFLFLLLSFFPFSHLFFFTSLIRTQRSVPCFMASRLYSPSPWRDLFLSLFSFCTFPLSLSELPFDQRVSISHNIVKILPFRLIVSVFLLVGFVFPLFPVFLLYFQAVSYLCRCFSLSFHFLPENLSIDN